MDLIEQLESLRVSDSEFFDVSDETRARLEGKIDMLDEVLEIVYQWLQKKKII